MKQIPLQVCASPSALWQSPWRQAPHILAGPLWKQAIPIFTRGEARAGPLNLLPRTCSHQLAPSKNQQQISAEYAPLASSLQPGAGLFDLKMPANAPERASPRHPICLEMSTSVQILPGIPQRQHATYLLLPDTVTRTTLLHWLRHPVSHQKIIL